jgi:hypothetical protein
MGTAILDLTMPHGATTMKALGYSLIALGLAMTALALFAASYR